MIINWKKDNVLIVNGAEVKARLLPGHNEVADDVWVALRPNVLDKIELGTLEEVNAEFKEERKRNEKGQLGSEVEVTVEVIPLSKMAITKATKIVSETNNLATLEAWKDEEGRDSVRAAILKQIEKVEKAGGK